MLIKFWPKETKLKFMSLRMAGILFSVMMMTASTIAPMAIAMPPRDMMFELIP